MTDGFINLDTEKWMHRSALLGSCKQSEYSPCAVLSIVQCFRYTSANRAHYLLRKGIGRNASQNGIKQLQQMAITDQQTKINQISYKFAKTWFPFGKACLCKYVWQAFTVNSSSWSATENTEESLKEGSAEDVF